MGVFKDFLSSLIRAGLYALFSWMIRKGWITQEQADAWINPMVLQIAGVLGFIGVYLWSARDTFKSWLFGKVALDAPSNASPEGIKRKIKNMPLKAKAKKVFSSAD